MLYEFMHDGVKLSYYDQGGGGTPLVFQHGLTGDHQQTVTSFLNKDYRLITLECRGHGGSELGPAAELGIGTFVADLNALLTHLDIRQAAFAGISMGAAIAANYAARYPGCVTHLASVRPAWLDGSCPDNMLVFGAAADFLDLHGPERGKEMFVRSTVYQTLLSKSPDNASSLAAIFDKVGTKARDMVALLRAVLTSDPGLDIPALSRQSIPTRVLATDNDAVHPLELAKRLADLLPQAEYVELYPKSLDKDRHIHELTDAIVRLCRQ
jgi:Predicted hydrolases or acyltransferases (alpha/beta hydrolase superfamily)